MAGRCWGVVDKVRHVQNTSGGSGKLKIFHSILKYNNVFVAQNISGNVIAFIGDRPLEGRPWIFKIPWDKPWAWT